MPLGEKHGQGTLQACLVDAIMAPELVTGALRLRRRVFAAQGAHFAETDEIDQDPFDATCKHIVISDTALSTETGEPVGVIGTCRLISSEVARALGGFYSEAEFDISRLKRSARNPLEIGRLCVLDPYRTGAVMKKVWRLIEEYVTRQEVDILFGCGSLSGTDPSAHAAILSLLAQERLAPEKLRTIARTERYVPMDTVNLAGMNKRQIYRSLPAPLNGYVGILGAFVGEGAVIDWEFGTTDVLIILIAELVTQSIRRLLAHE